MTFKIAIYQLYMTKLNPKNGNETKSDNFPWDILKPDAIPFLSKKVKLY